MHTADSLRTDFLSTFDALEPKLTSALGLIHQHAPDALVYLNYRAGEILISVVLPTGRQHHPITTALAATFSNPPRNPNINTKQTYETYILSHPHHLILSWI